MRIICPTCASHYEVDAGKIGAAGQLVRCVKCREVWLADPQERPIVPVVTAAFEPTVTGVPTTRADVGALSPPIDFGRARARLRRPLDGGVMGSEARGTLGALVTGALILAGAMGVLGGRTSIVRHMPATAGLYAAIGMPVNAQGLALRGVRSALAAEGDRTVLTLQGEITNLGDEVTPVPNLTVVVRDSGQAPLYTWTAASPKSKLAKGETVRFHSRLAAPPAAGQDVRVSFAEASKP